MREDLELRKRAKELGWKESLHRLDLDNGDKKTPALPIAWKKKTATGERNLWKCSKGWACAELKDGWYQGHRYYKTLTEALEKE